MRLVEKYRPRTLDDVIGQTEAVRKLRAYPDMGGRVWLFVGRSGWGKTSAAYCLGVELGTILPGETFQDIQMGRNLDVHFWSGTEMDKAAADDLADWSAFAPARARLKLAIIDEAQNISPKGREALLTVFESLRNNIVVVMTTTGMPEKKIAQQDDLFVNPKKTPFGSRCKIVQFVEPDTQCVVRRLVEIALKETGNGASLPYPEIIEQAEGNVRAAIDLLEDALRERR